MKYTISDVQQEKLLELGLDIKDAFILTYIRDLAGAESIISKIVDDEIYYWIDYQKMIDYMPILAIGHIKVIGRRITIYQDLGLVKRHLHKNFNQASGRASNNYTFITITPKFKELFEISKVKVDKFEIEEKAREMGLSTEDTQKFSRLTPRALKSSHYRGHSKVPSLEDTQKFLLNTSNNYTPNNNSSSGEAELKNRRRFVNEEFLNKNDFPKLSDFTKSNILKKFSKLDVIKFTEIYNKILKAESSGDVNDFNGALYSALLGRWQFKPAEEIEQIPDDPHIQEKIIWFKTSFGALDYKSYLTLLVKIPLDTLKQHRKRLGRMNSFDFNKELKKLVI